jgi:23S rRNA pseudouridine2605 synthase
MAKKSETTASRTAGKKTTPASAAKKPLPAKSATAKSATAKSSAAKTKAAAPAKAKSSPAKSASAKAAPAKAKAAPAVEAKTSVKKAVAKETSSKAKAAPKTKAAKKASTPPAPAIDFSASIEDPIGDTTDGEGRYAHHNSTPESLAEMAAYRADTAEDALEGAFSTAATSSADSDDEGDDESERGESSDASRSESSAQSDQPVHLDRLQKILSHAGIASRRHAEEMILAGRVVVNGQAVTTLGAKADPARDHIRVDGKIIPTAERHRYFVLNKPRGFVTTVSDPEGRPTVMQFFSKMRERLYPVGRLDYESEGLLLVTNDGELANQLTRAASGVEKTYLVKVAGRPTEEELERLRSGVFIERGAAGSEQTQTAPARIREFRSGAKPGTARAGAQSHSENPWYEVVLIEGRNRELRKMFQSVGHFVEKIRRVGYGPLVLDLPPGEMRELAPEELAALRRAAEGKTQRRSAKPASATEKAFRPDGEHASSDREPASPDRKRGSGERREFKPREREGRPFREQRPNARPDSRAGSSYGARERKPGFGNRPAFGDRDRARGPKPAFGDRGEKPAFGSRPRSGDRPAFGDRDRPRGPRPDFDKPRFGDRPDRPQGRPQDRMQPPRFDRDASGPGSRPPSTGRSFGSRPGFKRPGDAEKRFDRPSGRGGFDKPRGEGFKSRSEGFKPRSEGFKPRSEGFKPRGEGFKPRGEGFKPRSEGFKPRSAGFSPRPSGQFDRSAESRGPRPPRAEGAGGGSDFRRGPDSARSERPRREGSPDRKPASAGFGSKPRFGGKPAGSGSRPPFGGKPGFKRPGGARPGGPRSGGPRSGGPRPGGPRPGGNRFGANRSGGPKRG